MNVCMCVFSVSSVTTIQCQKWALVRPNGHSLGIVNVVWLVVFHDEREASSTQTSSHGSRRTVWIHAKHIRIARRSEIVSHWPLLMKHQFFPINHLIIPGGRERSIHHIFISRRLLLKKWKVLFGQKSEPKNSWSSSICWRSSITTRKCNNF